jgi:hypothetical protein
MKRMKLLPEIVITGHAVKSCTCHHQRQHHGQIACKSQLLLQVLGQDSDAEEEEEEVSKCQPTWKTSTVTTLHLIIVPLLINALQKPLMLFLPCEKRSCHFGKAVG